MFGEIWAYAMPYALGLVVALAWGQIVIDGTNKTLRAKLHLEKETDRGYRQSRILGLIESVLYLGAFLIRKPEFVAVWLGLKTVVRWRHWESDIPVGNKNGRPEYWVFGRDAYNLFLIGNALVLLFAASGWLLIELAGNYQPSKLIVALLGLALGRVALHFCVKHSGEYKKIPDGDPRLRISKDTASDVPRGEPMSSNETAIYTLLVRLFAIEAGVVALLRTSTNPSIASALDAEIEKIRTILMANPVPDKHLEEFEGCLGRLRQATR